MAAKQGIEATVHLELYVDRKGLIRRIDVLDDPGYGFAEMAVRAFDGITCTPARLKGQSVAVRLRFPVRFRLK